MGAGVTGNRDLFGPARTRVLAGLKVIRAAVRARVRVTRRRAVRLLDSDGQPLGFVDRIEVRNGTLRVEGWTVRRSLGLATEVGTTTVHPDIVRADLAGQAGAFGFDVSIPGTDFVTVTADRARPLRVRVTRAHHRALGWGRMGGALAALLVRNRPDLLGWFLRGDSEAGNRLERALVPPSSVRTWPMARAGLFPGVPGTTPVPPDPVDILIPVHDAHDDLVACLERIERFTDDRHRIILIDDASADPRIAPLLASLADRRGNVDLLANPRNLGFVGSVNLGLARCRGDVVLLNTDAMVAEGWLDRLLVPMRADPVIASVTPMTNNGEIASTPVICKARPLPEGAVDLIDAAAGRLDPLAAITDVPTGVGFCMAMAGAWLARAPRLDEAFGRGYGEEVDWCRKVAAMGARHVLTGAVFVEHRGGMSFGPEKARRIAENSRIISRRYPGFDASVAAFIAQDPAVGPRLALGLAAAAARSGEVPVYLAHRLGGGAEHWLADEIGAHLAAGQPVAVLRDGDAPDHVLLEIHAPEGVTTGQVPLDEMPRYLSGPFRRRMVYSNLAAARAPLDLLARAVSVLKPDDDFRIVFHDFLPLCPSYNLIDTTGRYCGLPEGPSCQRCYSGLATTSGQRPATVAEWRRSWHGFMTRATGIEVFSEDSRRQVCRVWPDLAPRITVAPHRPLHLPLPVAAPPPGRLTVGVLGGIGYSKGAKVLHDLADCMGPETDIVVIGKLDPDHAHPRIIVHGPYERDEIGALAARYRVGCWLVPSIWPETFCYAAHEALATGLPVFVYDLGAQAEAAKTAPNGHLLPAGCEGVALAQHLRHHGFRPPPDHAKLHPDPARKGLGIR